MLIILSCFLIAFGLVFLFAKEQLWNWEKRKSQFWRRPVLEQERPEWFDRQYTVWGLVALSMGIVSLVAAIIA